MSGKDHKLYISDDGTSSGGMQEVELQGDLTIRTGKTNEKTAFKNGSRTAQGADGWSASTTFAPVEPMSAAQALVFAAHSNGGDAYIQVKSNVSGSVMWAGPVKLVISEITHPISGVSTNTLQIDENGVVAQTLVP